MSNVLVVGGKGYIGRHLKKKFPEYIYTNSSDFDLSNTQDITSFCNKIEIDTCIILSAKISYNQDLNMSEEPFTTNVNGLNNLLKVLNKKNNLIKIIYFSSMTVYNKGNTLPVTESSDLLPLHDYGLTKVYAEELVKFYNFNSVIIRIPGVYGGDRKSGFIYSTINNLKKNNPIEIDTQNIGYWETIHIDDLIYLFSTFLNKYNYLKDFDVFNISYGEKTDFIKTVDFIKNEIGSHSIININKDYVDYYLCNKKISNFVTPKVKYYDRLKQYIKEENV